MALFSKTPKTTPKITVGGIEVTFHPIHKWWAFSYRDISFTAFEQHLHMPTVEQLDSILADVDTLKPQMIERISKGWSEWAGGGEVKMDDGESCSITIDEFAIEGSFEASWSGGASWGDMGIAFTIKDHKIVDESWSD